MLLLFGVSLHIAMQMKPLCLPIGCWKWADDGFSAQSSHIRKHQLIRCSICNRSLTFHAHTLIGGRRRQLSCRLCARLDKFGCKRLFPQELDAGRTYVTSHPAGLRFPMQKGLALLSRMRGWWHRRHRECQDTCKAALAPTPTLFSRRAWRRRVRNLFSWKLWQPGK